MKVIFVVIEFVRRIRSRWYTFIFKRMLNSYGSVGVNNFCKIARTARVDVGERFSSNGLMISGVGGGENR